MGADKALLTLRGVPLGAAVASVVQQAAGSAVIVGDPALYGALGFAAIPDLFPGEGPLGGIITAISHTAADWNLITACDMPELAPGFLDCLFEAAERSNARVLLPRGPGGRPEPLCAVYHRDALPALSVAFGSGMRKITAALESLSVEYFSVPDLKRLQNLNTPEEWSGYAAG
jgi:molybdopterin-guanine dinucleotide biosynthesis protein A